MRKTFAILALFLAAPAAQSAEYTLFIFESADQIAARNDPARARDYWGGYAIFATEAGKAGIMRGGAGVEASGPAVGPVPAAPGALGGYFVIDVPDLATARTWAERIPAAKSGRVEIRQHLPAMAR
jgi:hypothetical protein